MFKKAIFIIVGVLVVAIIALVIQERIWPPGHVLARSTTLTPLQGDEVMLAENEGEWEPVTETVMVREGDQVRTGNASWALVTFEDGTTIELEPNTEIRIEELTQNHVSIWQQVGRTWSGIKKLVGPLTDVQVETPSAVACVRGTLVDIVVDAAGNTVVSALEGVIEVTAEGISRTIGAGMQTLVNMGQAPSEPRPIPPPKNRLEITVRGEAWALVVDSPAERSVGVVPPGIVATQIPMATTTGAHAEPQFVVVPVPEEQGDWTYYIVLYGKDPGGSVNVEVKGFVLGANVFTDDKDTTVQPYEKEEDREVKYMATLQVTVNAQGDIASGELSGFELKESEGPGKVEIKDRAVDRAGEPMAPQANFSLSVKDGAVSFTSLSTGDITSHSWDFGDGATSQETSPSHAYPEAGVYIVTLEVSGPGGEDALSKEICVVLID